MCKIIFFPGLKITPILSILPCPFQDFVKKLIDRADERNRAKIPTTTLKAVFSATSDDQVAMMLKKFEG